VGSSSSVVAPGAAGVAGAVEPGERRAGEPAVVGASAVEIVWPARAGGLLDNSDNSDNPSGGISSGASGAGVGEPVGLVGAASGDEAARVPEKGFWRRAMLPLSVAAAAAFVAATGYLAVTDPRTDSGMGRWSVVGPAPTAVRQPAAVPTQQASHPPTPWSAGPANPNPFGPPPPALQGAPTRLRVAAIGVDTTLETLHLAKDGSLTPPKDFARAGWYADGTAPGDQGPAVIAGHVDSKRGPAVFYKLREMEPGDRIDVIRGNVTVHFTVVSTSWYPKTNFPTDLVYGPTPDRQLRLITCGGVFDHRLRSYKDNLVVYAVAG
jgi:hypothetical protein